jgi:hypothetical protein
MIRMALSYLPELDTTGNPSASRHPSIALSPNPARLPPTAAYHAQAIEFIPHMTMTTNSSAGSWLRKRKSLRPSGSQCAGPFTVQSCSK